MAGRVDQENLLLKKQGWRHLKSLAEFFDVLLVQLSFAMQDFGDDALRPEQRREVLLFEVVRRHQFRQHFHGRDRTDGKVFLFVSLNQNRQQFGVLFFGRRQVASALQVEHFRVVFILRLRCDRPGRGETFMLYFSSAISVIFPFLLVVIGMAQNVPNENLLALVVDPGN